MRSSSNGRRVKPWPVYPLRRTIVLGTANGLSEDPRPLGSRQLRDRPGRRLRVGDYRILYDVDDDRRKVLVAEVWHRQMGYR